MQCGLFAGAIVRRLHGVSRAGSQIVQKVHAFLETYTRGRSAVVLMHYDLVAAKRLEVRPCDEAQH